MFKKIIPALLFVLVAGFALAQAKPETKQVKGAVKSVSADSLVLTVDGTDWTFIVDEDTSVTAKGASHTSRAAEVDRETTTITDFVKVEQTFVVDYLEKDGKFTAREVRRVE